MTHIIRGRLLGLLTLASSSSMLPNYFLHDFLISRRDCIHQLMGLITQVFLFYLDYLCSWQSMLAIACQIVKRWSEAESFTIFENHVWAYYKVIFCHKFGEFFSLKILGLLYTQCFRISDLVR